MRLSLRMRHALTYHPVTGQVSLILRQGAIAPVPSGDRPHLSPLAIAPIVRAKYL